MQSKHASVPVPVSAGSYQQIRHRRPSLLLTDIQHAILRMLVQGSKVEDIAAMLDTRPRYIVFHKREMMRILGVANETELIAVARSSDLFDPPTPQAPAAHGLRSARAVEHDDAPHRRSVSRTFRYRLRMRRDPPVPVPAAVDEDAPTHAFDRTRRRHPGA